MAVAAHAKSTRSAITYFTRLSTATGLALMLALTGCQSNNSRNVSSDYSQSVNFAAYKTYGKIVLGESSTTPPEPSLQKAVQDTLDNQLVVRYIPVKLTEKGDFSLRYFIDEVAQPAQRSPVSGGVGVMGGSGGRTSIGTGISLNFPLGGASSPLRLRLVIDVIDEASGKQVWRGSKIVNTDGADTAQRNKDISTAAAEIIAAFPPN